MELDSARSVAVAVVAIVFVAVGGVAVVDQLPGSHADSEPDGEALVSEVFEADGATYETMQATREFELNESSEGTTPTEPTIRTVSEVWRNPPDGEREEVIVDTGPTSDGGDVIVINGTVRQHYFAADEQLLYDDEANWSVPRSYGLARADEIDAEYVRSASVDGRETHVVELRPVDPERTGAITLLVGDEEFELAVGESADADETDTTAGTTTWWIDVETGTPIRERVELRGSGPNESRTMTTTYTDVRFDEPIPDERFAFDPPTGTDVYEPMDSIDVESVTDADEALPFDVPEPDVPDRFRFGGVNANEFRGDLTAEFYYRDGDTSEDVWIRVTERPPRHDEDRSAVIEERVGPFEGVLAETFLGTTYAWRCDGVTHEVSVDLAAETDRSERQLAIDLAESMGCSS
ncbi:hypothetical protein JCM18237_15200 [Halorubrum luteum]